MVMVRLDRWVRAGRFYQILCACRLPPVNGCESGPVALTRPAAFAGGPRATTAVAVIMRSLAASLSGACASTPLFFSRCAGKLAARVPARARVDDFHHREHHRDLDQHTDHRGERRARFEAEQADRG